MMIICAARLIQALTLVYRFAIALAQCLDFQALLLNVSGALNNASGAAASSVQWSANRNPPSLLKT